MTAGELDVEVGDQSVDVIVPLHLEAERRGEGQVLRLHRVDVHLLKKQTRQIQSVVTSPKNAKSQYICMDEDGVHRSSTHPDETGVADQLLGVHHVNQGFFNSHLLDAGHIETVHVLPP